MKSPKGGCGDPLCVDCALEWDRPLREHPHTKQQKGDPDGVFPHEGDCIGSLCPTCGCCMHCSKDCGCEGCADDICMCNEKNG